MASTSTLLRPPPDDPALSVMENTLQLRSLSEISQNLYTNMRPLWHPPGARGVYGGAVIAQCLAAAQHTVSDEYTVHSMHCYFVLAGNADIPIIYHVERVRDGKSFVTRTVQARQRDRIIFTTTLSFMKTLAPDTRTLDHDTPMPDVPPPKDDESEALYVGHGPFESQHFDVVVPEGIDPHAVRTRSWLRARGKISKQGGHQAHLEALAYITDSFFIGTVSRAHRTWRSMPAKSNKHTTDQTKFMADRIREQNGGKDENDEDRPEIGMMVSLDHTIYFHRPREFAADDWLLSEMQTPWAGDGRGLVKQRIWSKDGRLIASCFQEGLARLKQSNISKL